MTFQDQLNLFSNKLEAFLQNRELQEENPLFISILKAKHFNRWFPENMVILRLQVIAENLKAIDFKETKSSAPKSVFVISEEHVPLEEFSTVLFIIQSGHKVFYKENKNSDPVFKSLFEWMASEIPAIKENIHFVQQPQKAESYYITSRNPKPEIELAYFKSRNTLFESRYQSAAIINGDETNEQLKNLAHDVFSYYGQASSNVKKIFVPENYDVRRILDAFQESYSVMDHNPYANNYQYQQSVYLMNRVSHYDNGFLLLRETAEDQAPTGVLYYEYYKDAEDFKALTKYKNFYRIFRAQPEGKNEAIFGSSDKHLFSISNSLRNFLQ